MGRLACSTMARAVLVMSMFLQLALSKAQGLVNASSAVEIAVAESVYLLKPTPVQCLARFKASVPVSIIMVADNGTFSGTSEAAYILGLLKNTYSAPQNAIPCQSIVTGTLFGQPVVVITSGIGPEAAAVCATYITDCASSVKDFVYAGTAGWSSQVGGALNAVSGVPGSCTPNVATTRTRIGDVAITPYSVNWECKLASWTEQCSNFPNICTYPVEDAGPTVTSLYGQCVFSTKTAASTALSDELVAATKTPQFAANALQLQALFNSQQAPLETAYWAATTAGNGLTYPALPPWTGPAILNYTQAVEIDGQFFFSGTPWDMVARNYSAVTLNLANNSTLTQADVVAVNAEEGVGVSFALDLYNSLVGVPKIPYTIVRGNSDFLYAAPQQTAPGVWMDNPNSPVQNFDTQYQFAIQSLSTVILTTFQLRCLAAGNAAATCAYVLPTLP